MAWGNNFDSETTGETPEDWEGDAAGAPNTFEISEAQYYSPSKSSYLKSEIGTSAYIHTKDDAIGTTTDATPFHSKHYLPDSTGYAMILHQQINGDISAPNIGAQVFLDNTSGTLISPLAVGYYNGNYVDTGKNWDTSTWFKITIINDFSNNQFDLYYDDVLIEANAGFRENISEVKVIFALIAAGGHEIYSDDHLIGDVASGHGMLLSTHRNRIVGAI